MKHLKLSAVAEYLAVANSVGVVVGGMVALAVAAWAAWLARAKKKKARKQPPWSFELGERVVAEDDPVRKLFEILALGVTSGWWFITLIWFVESWIGGQI